MEDVDKYLSSRRDLIKIGATAAVAGLAGCSGNNDGNGEDTINSTDTENPADEPGTQEDDPTASEEPGTQDNETSSTEQDNGDSSLYEEDEPQAEAEWDDGIYLDAWIEMENPSEQIPEENYDIDEFPNLEIFEEVDTYAGENEAIYLGWLDTGDRVELGGFVVRDYENSNEQDSTSGSAQYTDQSADVGRILEEVIKGVDDVSEDISDEYIEILRSS